MQKYVDSQFADLVHRLTRADIP